MVSSLLGDIEKMSLVPDCGCSERNSHKGLVTQHKTSAVSQIIIVTFNMMKFNINFSIAAELLK